jgi:hypothetical protein
MIFWIIQKSLYICININKEKVMDINIVINDYIENFDIEVGSFNDFITMAQDYKNSQELESINKMEAIDSTNDLPF